MSPELQLAALLCSRVCHDLISPISALTNGLEVLSEENDPGMRDHALSLLALSGSQASAKLQFARLAFGSASGSPSEVHPDEARGSIAGILDGGKFDLVWNVPDKTMDKDWIKILMNAVLLARDSIPRGGVIEVAVEDKDGKLTLDVTATGESARVSEVPHAALDGLIAIDTLDPRSVQPYFMGLLVRERGAFVAFEKCDENKVRLRIAE